MNTTSSSAPLLSRRRLLRATAALPLAGLGGLALAQNTPAALPVLQVWKDPNCGCCNDWVALLRADGFRVQIFDSGNTAVRQRLGLPAKYGSCHTALVGGYVVEGHIPASDIKRLLAFSSINNVGFLLIGLAACSGKDETAAPATDAKPAAVEIMGPAGMEDMAEQIRGMFAQLGQGKRKTRKVTVAEARTQLIEEEAAKLLNEEEIRAKALERAEQNGIVFIDEIDKVASRSENQSADVSRQGVQRDLLPLVEGTTVNTKYGMVKTDHMLFIASGAFHLSRPSDLIPELQGRFPIRVELSALSVDDFEAILTQPSASLIKQYQALLATEGVSLRFTDDAIRRIAELACQVNERTENIGARRLATMLERLLEELSFQAPNLSGQDRLIDATEVNQRLNALAGDEDLSRFIL